MNSYGPTRFVIYILTRFDRKLHVKYNVKQLVMPKKTILDVIEIYYNKIL